VTGRNRIRDRPACSAVPQPILRQVPPFMYIIIRIVRRKNAMFQVIRDVSEVGFSPCESSVQVSNFIFINVKHNGWESYVYWTVHHLDS